ncbi:hypothetical protein FEDK69T_01790 [Flavobacterium enshiense DK69]|nr:hypothetical protein FEDK69T_01790 [Flavobacterium enshiense DK69]
MKPNQDLSNDSLIEIPVIKGKFHYETKLQNPEAVLLLLGEAKNGLGRIMELFLENETITLTIYPEKDFDKNMVQGGKLNAEYKKFKQNEKLKYISKIKQLNDSINVLNNTDKYDRETLLNLSSKRKLLEDKLKLIYAEHNEWKQKYINENPTIVSYSFLLNELIYGKETIDINLAKNNYDKLSKANPKHPYNELALNMINAIDNIKIGKNYVDFSAPDLNGNIVNLSDKIKGRIVLLDLWSTWCSPCIEKSRTMVPVYNEYKNKGFTIIGVGGESKNTDRLTKFLEKEKWPWLNLVELDKQNKIWQKYSIGNGGGGGMFLIDDQGKIIAIDPTAEEVKKELEARLR